MPELSWCIIHYSLQRLRETGKLENTYYIYSLQEGPKRCRKRNNSPCARRSEKCGDKSQGLWGVVLSLGQL